MNRKKALKNIIFSTLFKIIIVIVTILARSFLMRYLGKEATGLYSLYVSILGFLSIAELGVGTAISFSMYKPLVEKDSDTVSALYYLFKRIYIIMAVIILIFGLAISPFIPVFAKENTGTFNIFLTYMLFLVAQITTYFYAYKTSFINANTDNYITTTIHSIGLIVTSIFQILVLYFFRSFILFLVAIIIGNLLQWIATSLIFEKKYRQTINFCKLLQPEVKKQVTIKTKAMFFHKIGGLLVNSLDSIIIGAFISVNLLGVYSNYISIVTGMLSVLSLLFSSISSLVGHSYAKNSNNMYFNQFKKVYLINYIVGFIFFSGFFAVIRPLIVLLFTEDSLLPTDVVLVITLNYFIQFMRQSVLTFKDSAGLFYYDRFKPIFEGVTNLVLSILFVFFLGIKGVLIATIITNLFIDHIIEPKVLFKYGFEQDAKKFIGFNYILILIFVLTHIIYSILPFPNITNPYIAILLFGSLSIIFSCIILLFVILPIKSARLALFSFFGRKKLHY